MQEQSAHSFVEHTHEREFKPLETGNCIPLEPAVSESTQKTNSSQFSLHLINSRTPVGVWIQKIGVLSSLCSYCAPHCMLISSQTVSIDSWLALLLRSAQAILFLYQKTKKPKTFSFKAVLLFFVMKQCYPVCNQKVGVSHQRQNTS